MDSTSGEVVASPYRRRLAEQRDREQRAQVEREQRANAEARAELDAVRRLLALEVASASPQALRRLAQDPAFVRTLEDLFGDE